jgi:chromosome segregation ATPase
MQIVDNAPEMDPNSPEFGKILAQMSAQTVEKEAEQTDVKEEASSAPPAPQPDQPAPEEKHEEQEEETPEKLKARIRGLQAELTRRKGNAEKVSELEAQLARVQSQLDTLTKAPRQQEETIEDLVRKLDDKALVSKEVDWNDELTDARTRYAQAEERGDEKAMERHASRIMYAKKVLAALKAESSERRERKQLEAEQLRTEQAKVKAELESMYSLVMQNFPEFKDQNSDLWKAGKAAYDANPELMKRLGPASEIVAAAVAVLENPHLVKGKTEAEARKAVVSKLESGLKKSLQVGATSPTTARIPIPSVDTSEGLAQFNALVDRLKGG